MNDISLKIVDSPKADVVYPTLAGGENEVDPLAISEEVVGTKDPLVVESVPEPIDSVKAGNCDAIAKEKNSSDNLTDGDYKLNDLQSENNDDLLRDGDSPSTLTFSESITTKVDEEPIIKTSSIAPVVVEETAPIVPEVTKPVPVEESFKEIPKSTVSKEPSPVKEVESKIEAPKKEEQRADAEMNEAPPPVEEKTEPKVETRPKPLPMNGDLTKEEQGIKRRTSEEIETESPLKKLCQEVEKTFPQHDTMINDYIHTATKNNVDEIQRHTEQLLSEIQTLRELAQKKEHEWNNILHLKKVKEEILLRLLRRKQVLSFEKSVEMNGAERNDPFDYLNQAKNLAIDKSDEISGLSLKQPGSNITPMMQTPVMPVTSHFNPLAGLPPPYDKAHMQSMPKPVFPQPMMMPGPLPGFPRDMSNMNGQLPTSFGLPMGRQGPTKDVKSIIADYRQRNPEVTPRRGRRMKSILNPNMMNAPRPIAPKIDGLSNLNNLNMLFNNLDMNQKAMLERLQQMQAGGLPNGLSFKDVLVQFANMQQTNVNLMPSRPMDIPNRPDHIRPEGRRRMDRNHEQERIASSSPRLPPPPPYPEISLLPVTTSQETATQQNSLLHGILTKQASAASQSYSPTLAKLLTSPERKQTGSAHSFVQAKNCGEITITPVQPAPQPQTEAHQEKTEEVVQLDDEESPASEGEASGSPGGSGSGRLVIDEGSSTETTAEAGAGGPSNDVAEGEGEAECSEGADTPLCQGCKRRDAQFVCAGCANQWYCSRDCQVAAWDDHSEMCSG